ncbi:hypothetical protein AB0K16_22295 [Nonomuraea jabiensis]|uniref:hypothetical protein n=1 Tax=Nonomuraea jabiensis TaxID=882448 RepID=UPI003428D9BF
MAEEAKIRLVVCPVCKTIEEIPDFNGPVKYDTLLDNIAARHEYAPDRPHEGLKLFDVKQTDWNSTETRLQIIKQLKERVGDGLGDAFYAVKETFKEDAQKCWRQHNKTMNCDDYMKDHKRLDPGTKHDRKELGLAPMRSEQFLCHFCVYGSVVMQRARAAKGLYDYNL